MIYRLIYTSRAAPNVTDADFRTISMFSSLRNKRGDISGLLLHYDGKIMQVLEGPEEAVKQLFGKIEKDKRHFDVRVEASRSCSVKIFQEWSMGYRPLSSAADMDAFFELTKDNLESAIPSSAPIDLLDTIGDYAKSAGIT